MKQAVLDAFNAFTEPLEGHCSWMYLDTLGLVTTGRGNLIDPISASLRLPWTHKDGTPATIDQIAAEWTRIKAMQSWKVRGGYAFSSVASLWLSEDAINALCISKVLEIEADLVKRFPDFEDWPADAQLALLSMSWAMGARFHFPRFEAAVLRQDFDVCADECDINATGNPGVIPRNNANRRMFHNAAAVVRSGLDLVRDVLHYPDALT